MTDVSRNWYDLSVNSNILKQTYINGFIDVSSNIVGRKNLLINNEKNVGDTRFGLGTLYPSVTFDAMNNEPAIRITNTALTAATQNDTTLGTIEFVSPIYRGVTGTGYQTSATLRCQNIYDEYNYNGSLIFSVGGGQDNAIDKMTLRGNNGYIGIGTNTPESSLHVNGNLDVIKDVQQEEGSYQRYGDIEGFGILPIGSIIMLFSAAGNDRISMSSIYSQGSDQCWRLCDGSTHNGITTPDLRNKFIVGAGDDYDVGATGGEDSVTLTITTMPKHSHSQKSTSSGATHSHVPVVSDANDYNYDDYAKYGGPYTMGTDDRWNNNKRNSEDSKATGSQGSHSHSIGNTGSSEAHENRPPFYALSYIMRVY